MRRLGLMMVAGLWVAVAATGAMAADLPRTIQEQAESIGDDWAAYLAEEYGDALSAESTVGPRQELVEGLKDVLKEPLTRDRFDCVRSWVLTGLNDWNHPPLELQLRERVRIALYDTEQFLSRPFPDGDMVQQAGFQVGGLYYLLQQYLISCLAPLMEDEEAAGKAIAGGILMGGYQQLLPQLRNPVSPVFKRALSPEELTKFEAQAWGIAQAHSESLVERLAGQHEPREVTAEDVRHEAWVAASDLAGRLQRLYFDERPPMLSREEREALSEAIAVRYSAEEPTV